MTVLSQSNSERIRKLNDSFRQTFAGGTVVLTQGVNALSAEVKTEVLNCVRNFDRFDHDNDPHGEHDFGNFEFADQRFFFKVDYYNLEMEGARKIPPTLRRPHACSQ